GKILAEAAAIYDEKNATQSQSYGPEARGGASKSEVIISDGEIDYPKAEDLDLLLALTQESFDKYHKDLRVGGFLVVDTEAVTRLPDVSKWKLVRVPFEKLAREQLGKSIVANIVAIGVIVRLSGVVTEQAAEQAILARVPRGTEDLNRQHSGSGSRRRSRSRPEQLRGRCRGPFGRRHPRPILDRIPVPRAESGTGPLLAIWAS